MSSQGRARIMSFARVFTISKVSRQRFHVTQVWVNFERFCYMRTCFRVLFYPLLSRLDLSLLPFLT